MIHLLIFFFQGIDSMSDYPVTFHYVSVEQMYNLEYYIYHMKPYGIQLRDQDLNAEAVAKPPPTTATTKITTRTSARPTLITRKATTPPIRRTTKAASGNVQQLQNEEAENHNALDLDDHGIALRNQDLVGDKPHKIPLWNKIGDRKLNVRRQKRHSMMKMPNDM